MRRAIKIIPLLLLVSGLAVGGPPVRGQPILDFGFWILDLKNPDSRFSIFDVRFEESGRQPSAIGHRPSQIQNQQRRRQFLPEGPGRDLLLQACVQCHDLRIIVSQHKTAVGWRRTVNEMIWRGTQLMSDETEVVINYLAASFEPAGPAPNSRKETPAGAAKRQNH
jgi:hypothetical protein